MYKFVRSIGVVAILAVTLIGTVSSAFAVNTSTLSQSINAGALAVDIVDNTGKTVAAPSIAFSATNFSFNEQTTTATLGSSAGAGTVVRTLNPTASATWNVGLAATDGPTALWTSGSDSYDFNDGSGADDGADTDNAGGQLTWTGEGSVQGVPDNTSCPNSALSIATAAPYEEGASNSVNVLTGGAGATTFCRWDYSSSVANLSQVIPAGQKIGTYTLGMTLTIS